MVCSFLHENSWRCSIIESFPSSGSCKHYAYFPCEFDFVKGNFWEIKHDIFLWITSFNCYNLKYQGLYMAILSLISHVSRSYGQIPFSTQNLSENSTINIEWSALKQPFHMQLQGLILCDVKLITFKLQ